MAKMRGIKPEFWTDSKVVRLSPSARLLFIGSWHYACDNGHVDGDPIELKMRVLPADPVDCEALVEEITKVGLFVAEEDGYTIPNFRRHQKIDARYPNTCDRCTPEQIEEAKAAKRTRGHGGSTPGTQGEHTGSTPSAHGHTSGTQRAPVGSHDEGEGEGEGEGERKGRRKRATAAPETLPITEAMTEWAKTNAPLVDLKEATEEFLTWAKSVDKRYADWTAAWRNAIKRRQEWAVRDGRHLRPVDDNRPEWMLA